MSINMYERLGGGGVTPVWNGGGGGGVMGGQIPEGGGEGNQVIYHVHVMYQ